jgi:acyl dehydratase
MATVTAGPDRRLGFGVVVPSDSPDPAADVRRIESLGFDHAALLDTSPQRVLIALGATRTIGLLVPPDAHPGVIAGLPPEHTDRVVAWPANHHVTPLDVAAPGALTEAMRLRRLQEPVTVSLTGAPHGRAVLDLALELGVGSPEPGRLFAEDLAVGEPYRLGSHEVTLDEIVAFAERWDPQEFHIDADRAATSPLGVLCASGIHTQAIMQRLSARGLLRNVAVVAGRAMRSMRLTVPVTPGMRLEGCTEFLEVRRRPTGRAVVTIRSTLSCGDQLVMEQVGELVVLQRFLDDDISRAPA